MEFLRRLRPGWILQWVVSVPIRALRPFLVIRLVRFHTPYGFMLRCPFYYLLRREEEQKATKRYLDIVFWSGPTPNVEFASFWRRHMFLLPEFLHRFLWKPLHVVAWYWQRNDVMRAHTIDYRLADNWSSNRINADVYNAATLIRNEDSVKLQTCLEHLGVSAETPIALIHVRNAYHDLQSQTLESYDVHCVSADPKKFQQAVDWLIGKGFAVLTVGNHPSSPSGLKGVVEYHKSPQRSALLDFMVGSKSRLYLGTAAGALSAVAFHFRLPAVLTNHLLWGSEMFVEMFSYGRAVFLLKNVWVDGQELSQSEIMESNLSSSDKALRERGVTLRENSSQDILDALQEVMALGTSPEAWNQARQGQEQSAFWEVFDAHTRLDRVCKQDGAVISPSFLRRNPHWLR